MVSGLNKIATALIAVFLLTFLLLVAQILYIFSRWRYQPGAQPNGKCFYIFCWRSNHSRIEPKEIASISKIHGDSEGVAVVVETAAADNELELCGPSRTLFTIKEEEEREGIIECFEYDPIHKVKPDEEETTPFHTPCASPPYFTPSSSPARDFPADRGCSDDIRAAPFLAIQITTHGID